MSVNEEKKFVMKHTYSNLKYLKSTQGSALTTVDGKEEKHFNVPWKTSISYNGYIQYPTLDFSLEKSCEDEWSIDATIVTRILANDGCYRRFEERQLFGQNNAIFAFPLPLEPLSLYLICENVTVEYHVTIHKITGIEEPFVNNFDDESRKKFSDVTLIAKDQKFYVNKMYLAGHSTYFKSLFLGKKRSKVKLEGVNPSDVQKFLEVLYCVPDINDSTVKGTLHLADKYDAKTVIRQCEKFLVKESKLDHKEKLFLATQYKLDKLREVVNQGFWKYLLSFFIGFAKRFFPI